MLISVVILVLSCIAGGLLAFFLHDRVNKSFLDLTVSFSGAYLLGITILELIPQVYEVHSHHIGQFVLVGFVIQILLVQLSRGLEHGHFHILDNESFTLIIGMLLGLSVHAFMEGLPLSYEFTNQHTGQALLYGIAIHKLPAAFALAVVLKEGIPSKFTIGLCLLFFTCMTPLGMLAGKFWSSMADYSIENYAWIVAIVIGSFLHISTTIIFESSGKLHKVNILRLSAILVGFAICYLSLGGHNH